MKILAPALAFLVSASSLVANDDCSPTAHFDTTQVSPHELNYDINAADEQANITSFKIAFSSFLSNECGERFALVTIHNQNPGQRTFHERDVIGILANGERIFPLSIDGETSVSQKESVLLHFGTHRFPLVKLETRN